MRINRGGSCADSERGGGGADSGKASFRFPFLLAAFLFGAFQGVIAAPPARPAAGIDSASKAPGGAPQAPAKPANPPGKTPKITDGQRDFCNLVRGCGLPVPQGYCPDPKLIRKADFAYDSARCAEARLLNGRGVAPGHPLYGYKLYRFLGMEYRTLYNIEDALPISEQRLAYLLGDLPLAARLVSRFRKEPYTAEYVDGEKRRFKGTKGKRLSGDATLLSGSTGEKRLFYFGSGTATVAWWTLKGPALLDFTYWTDASDPKLLRYRMKLLVFPGNGVINGIMNLGLFRKVVLSKVKEVLKDITETAKQLAAPGAAGQIQSAPDWTPEEKRKIEEFLKLP